MSYVLTANGQYNSSSPSLSNGQVSPIQLDASGNLLVNIKTALPAGSNLIGGVELYDAGGTNKLAINSSGYITVDIAASQTIAVTNTGTFAVQASQVPSTSGGVSANVQQALTTSASVKGSAGQLYGFDWFNPNSGTVYVFIYNATSAPTIGSTTNLIYQKGIPAGAGSNVEFQFGIPCGTGIYIAVSTSPTSSAAPSTGLVLTTLYE
jgi:hypothetical protein